jgi:hypothetical protein
LWQQRLCSRLVPGFTVRLSTVTVLVRIEPLGILA